MENNKSTYEKCNECLKMIQQGDFISTDDAIQYIYNNIQNDENYDEIEEILDNYGIISNDAATFTLDNVISGAADGFKIGAVLEYVGEIEWSQRDADYFGIANSVSLFTLSLDDVINIINEIIDLTD